MWLFELFKPNIAKLEKRGNIKGLIRALRYRRDPRVRERALEALGRLKDPKAITPIVKALKDKNLFVRERAIHVLGHFGDERAVEPLIMALKSPNGVLRAEAAKALGRMKQKQVLDPLTSTLKDEKDYVRKQAAKALGELGEMAIAPLINALHVPDWRLREGVTMALGEIGDAALDPLMEAIDDSNGRVRQGAAIALGKLHDKRAVDRLISALKDNEHQVRHHAAFALFEKGWKPRTRLEQTLHAEFLIDKGQWGNVRKQGEAAIRPLVAKLKDRADVSWEKALQALEHIVGEDVVEPLALILQHGGGLDMWTAAWAQRAINNEKCIRFMIAVLGEPGHPVCRNAEEALVKLGKDAVPYLIETLADKKSELRKEAAAILGRIGDHRALKSLARAARDHDESLRPFAMEALESIGAPLHTT